MKYLFTLVLTVSIYLLGLTQTKPTVTSSYVTDLKKETEKNGRSYNNQKHIDSVKFVEQTISDKWQSQIRDSNYNRIQKEFEIEIKETPNKVYEVFDISSQPPGGWPGFYRLLEREVSLLDVASTATGTVKIQLVVLRDGTLADFEILQDNEARFANDLLKLLKGGRKWQSAIRMGRPVATKRNVAFSFN